MQDPRPQHGPSPTNLLVATALAMAVLVGYHFLYEAPRLERLQAEQARVEQLQDTDVLAPDVPEAAALASDITALDTPADIQPRDTVLAKATRLPIMTPELAGSLSLTGARLDDLILTQYFETVEREDPVTLLSPAGTAYPYYAEFGWTSRTTPVPDGKTVWTANNTLLTPDTPVTLTWTNPENVTFRITYTVDEQALFTVTQEVVNNGAADISAAPFRLISRHDLPPLEQSPISFVGPISVQDGKLEQVKYEDLQEEGVIEWTSEGGWLGFTDKYWLMALAPDQDETLNGRFVYTPRNGRDIYQSDIIKAPVTIAPGAADTTAVRLFAGAKKARLLDQYSGQYGIPRFDRAVDFGRFYFMTKPFFLALTWLGDKIGNFGIAILCFTVLLRLLVFPMANKSYKEMSRMRVLQPQMEDLKDRFGDDPERFQKEMMELYKREKVNPVSGCLPMFLQIPIFFALYKVLFVTIEMRHAPFFGWINDLSAPDPTTVFNLFGVIPWDPPSFLMIGAWPLLMGTTMFIQQKMNPAPPDPVQAKVFMFLPVIFTLMLSKFAAGLVIYWTWSNLLAMVQQYVIIQKYGRPQPVVKKAK